jgi:hypothetical protein
MACLGRGLCLCLLAIAWLAFGHRPIAPAEPRLRSLAVLPLKNLSGDPAQEYFADGMTEEVIGRLSMIRGLRVSVLAMLRAPDARVLDVAVACGFKTQQHGRSRLLKMSWGQTLRSQSTENITDRVGVRHSVQMPPAFTAARGSSNKSSPGRAGDSLPAAWAG